MKRIACDSSFVVVTEDERGTPLGVSPKQRVVSTSLRRALLARDRCCAFPGCHRKKFVQAHHVEHWIEGGETTLQNLVLLCSYHHRLLHEGGYRIGQDYRGELYFMRADGRAIPRCGYRVDDYTDDYVTDNPSMEGSHFDNTEHEMAPVEGCDHTYGAANPSMEVREPRGVYHLRVT